MVGIVIINYKREDLTVRFVREELSRIRIPHMTVIVNLAASDESNEHLCKELEAKLVGGSGDVVFSQESICVLPSPENLGFAKGNNLGAAFCRKNGNPDYLLFANNDIRFLDDDVVAQMVEKLESLPDAAVIGPRVVGLDGKAQSPFPYMSFWRRRIWMYWSTPFLSKEKKIRQFQLDYPEKAKEGYHYYVMGCFFLVRAADFYACGMMDPHTFLYAEEPILSERMAAIGKKFYYFPETCVLHAHGATTSHHSVERNRRWQFESEVYYYRTYRHTSRLVLLLGRVTYKMMEALKNERKTKASLHHQ